MIRLFGLITGFRERERTWLGKSLESLPSQEQIDRMIARETARAERDGNHFSVALFRVKRGRNGALRRVAVSERRLALTLLRRVRLTDEVGWFDDRHLCVLLPDTSAAGARIVADSVCDLVAHKSTRPIAVIYSYPFQESEGHPSKRESEHANRLGRSDQWDLPDSHDRDNQDSPKSARMALALVARVPKATGKQTAA